jgi:hypothetical protein
MTCDERIAWVKAKDRQEKELRLDRAISAAKGDDDGALARKRWIDLCVQGESKNIVRLHEKTEYEAAKEASHRHLANAVANIRNDPKPFEAWADAFLGLPSPKGGTVGEQWAKSQWESLSFWDKAKGYWYALCWKLWGKKFGK